MTYFDKRRNMSQHTVKCYGYECTFLIVVFLDVSFLTENIYFTHMRTLRAVRWCFHVNSRRVLLARKPMQLQNDDND